MKLALVKNAENFIVFLPKDVVSGDFYWFTSFEIKNELVSFMAVVDCTGHGVPGAFMSMIGSSVLNEIIKQRKIFSPKNILTHLKLEIEKLLRQATTNNSDGMDMVLCKITKKDDDKSEVVFSGAKRDLFYYKENDNLVNRLKADRISIGGIAKYKSKSNFKDQTIILQKNYTIYLLTDGYIDQNNIARKRFGTIQFIDTLKTLVDKPLTEQKQILKTTLKKWQEQELQRDDITIVGLKI